MTGRRSSTSTLLGMAAVAALMLSWTALAQQPGAGGSSGTEPPAPGGPPTAPAPVPPTAGPQVTPSFVQIIDLQTQAIGLPGGQRFSFTIDAKTPTKDLLPTPPAVKPIKGPVLNDDLKSVPEIEFQARAKITNDGKLTEQTAHQLAKINHMNAKKTDEFMRGTHREPLRPRRHAVHHGR